MQVTPPADTYSFLFYVRTKHVCKYHKVEHCNRSDGTELPKEDRVGCVCGVGVWYLVHGGHRSYRALGRVSWLTPYRSLQ